MPPRRFGLDRLVGDASGRRHAGKARDRFARVAGNARGLGEGPARAGFDHPDIRRLSLHHRQRLDHDAAIDADHRQHDAEQQAQPDTGQQEAAQMVPDIAIGEVHGAASTSADGPAFARRRRNSKGDLRAIGQPPGHFQPGIFGAVPNVRTRRGSLPSSTVQTSPAAPSKLVTAVSGTRMA